MPVTVAEARARAARAVEKGRREWAARGDAAVALDIPLKPPTEREVPADPLGVLPAAVIDQYICDSGIVPVRVDACGSPLDVGREQRLFTPPQRIALAVRDGGCRWTGCDRPASYCEAHHIDEWHRDSGRTDIDRGVLLCRFHHMELHHGGGRITRDGKGDFRLHDPGGGVRALRARGFLSYAWGELGPPPLRFRPAVA